MCDPVRRGDREVPFTRGLIATAPPRGWMISVHDRDEGMPFLTGHVSRIDRHDDGNLDFSVRGAREVFRVETFECDP